MRVCQNQLKNFSGLKLILILYYFTNILFNGVCDFFLTTYDFFRFTYLGIITVLYLIVEYVKVGLGHRFLLAVGDRRYVRIVRFLGMPQGEEIPGLYERRHELRVTQRLHACILRVDGMLNRSFPVGVLVHHLCENEFQVCHSLS